MNLVKELVEGVQILISRLVALIVIGLVLGALIGGVMTLGYIALTAT